MEWQGPEPTRIRDMFSDISGRYDLANSVLSGGIHHLWRRDLVRWSEASAGQKVLDCATGTGDLAIAFKEAVGPAGHVIGTDFCREMIELAPEKAQTRGLEIKFQQADAMNLPFENEAFDICSISFGIRNVEHPKRAISEMARVVRPGGCVMVLEFGQPRNSVLRSMYAWYAETLLPRLGGMVTGQRQAYEYLHQSSFAFPYADNFVAMMRESGPFTDVECRSLSFGIAYLYKARVGSKA